MRHVAYNAYQRVVNLFRAQSNLQPRPTKIIHQPHKKAIQYDTALLAPVACCSPLICSLTCEANNPSPTLRALRLADVRRRRALLRGAASSAVVGAGTAGDSEGPFDRKRPSHCMIRLVGIFMNDDVRHVCVERKLQAIRGQPVICRVRRQDQLWNMVADLTGSETRIAG